MIYLFIIVHCSAFMYACGQKRAPELNRDGCEPSCSCGKPNPGSLEGQPVLLAFVPSPQPYKRLLEFVACWLSVRLENRIQEFKAEALRQGSWIAGLCLPGRGSVTDKIQRRVCFPTSGFETLGFRILTFCLYSFCFWFPIQGFFVQPLLYWNSL